jgi:hypothetical protein
LAHYKQQKAWLQIMQQNCTLSIEKKTGMRVAKEWANNEVTHYGNNRYQKLSSLRKKMFKHKENAGHKAALKLLAEAEKETLPTVLVKTLAREKEITSKIFRTAYKVEKEKSILSQF